MLFIELVKTAQAARDPANKFAKTALLKAHLLALLGLPCVPDIAVPPLLYPAPWNAVSLTAATHPHT